MFKICIAAMCLILSIVNLWRGVVGDKTESEHAYTRAAIYNAAVFIIISMD